MAPSLTTLLTLTSLLTSTTLAAPSDYYSPGHSPPTWPKYSPHRLQTLKPLMPTLDGLACTSNVTLFAPTLGIGSQNYTCNGTDFVQSDPHSGALAALYDISTLLMRDGAAAAATLAQDITSGRRAQSELGPQIGLHYFSEENVPVFNLTEAPEEAVLAGAKIAAVEAPESERDVPWLFLLDAGNGVSRKLNTVYRVDTEKGVKHRGKCHQEGRVVVKEYAAQYWFYY